MFKFQPDCEFNSPITANMFEYSTWDSLICEEIDDEHVHVGGYIDIIKDYPSKIFNLHVWSEIYNEIDNEWVKGPIDVSFPNLCMMLLQPGTSWFEFTKKFRNCMPKKGVCETGWFSIKSFVF